MASSDPPRTPSPVHIAISPAPSNPTSPTTPPGDGARTRQRASSNASRLRAASLRLLEAPFPNISRASSPGRVPDDDDDNDGEDDGGHTRPRRNSSVTRLRSASLRLMEANPPRGMWYATGDTLARAPSLRDIRGGAYDDEGWNEHEQRERSNTEQRERSGSVQRVRSHSAQRPRSDSVQRVRSDSVTRERSTTEQRERSKTETMSRPASRIRLSRRISAKNAANMAGLQSESTVLDPRLSEGDEREPFPSMDVRVSEADEAERFPYLTPEERTAKRNYTLPSRTEALAPEGADQYPKSTEEKTSVSQETTDKPEPPLPPGAYPNGYVFPPKHTWAQSCAIGWRAYWKFFKTPFGFLVTVYGLNIIAWGAMVFFVLLEAAPAMCHPNCNDINSPRRKWIEWDSQILTALFCVTAYGLAPWRFRDLYYLMQYRLQKRQDALRRLAGIYRSWFRLPDSESLIGNEASIGVTPDPENDPTVPLPPSAAPNPPLTGIRAPATAIWKLDWVIWSNVWNTLFQVVLCGVMWGFNRHTRPAWSDALFMALGCVVGATGGLMVFWEGRKVKRVEGVPWRPEDYEAAREAERAMELQNKEENSDGRWQNSPVKERDSTSGDVLR
ncbi:MAG: hypothetical protein M1819_003881 [Sarea resinae]|nr:MAG: hypothetical protein M1819_003881 [Sarea resinae]